MSHNTNCYLKRIRKKDAHGMVSLKKLFKQSNTESSEVQGAAESSEVQGVGESESHTEEGDKNDIESQSEQSDNECENLSDSVKLDQRLFSSEKYETRYKWLYYDFPNRGYMCKVCEMFGKKSGKFTTGCSLGDHPTRVLESHAASVGHKDAEQIQSSRKSGSVHSLILARKTAPQTATYLSSTTVTELIEILSEHIERDLLLSLRNAQAFTLLADESSDEAGREQFALYGKWEDWGGEIKERFLGVIHVPKTDSESLLNQIKHFMVAKDIQLKRMRFMAFDGANVMSGEKTGVQRRLRHESPHALYMNCRCHKLALCLKHIMKLPEFAVLQEVDSVLLGLWKVFEYSPKKFCVFKEVQTTYGNKSLKLIRAATTRWLSHGDACSRFVSRFSQILDALDSIYDDRKEPEVFGLRCAMLRKDVVAMIYLLCDVLQIVNGLSAFLQSENLNFTDVPHKVDAAFNKLHMLIDQLGDRGNNTHLTFSAIDDAFIQIIDRTSLQRRMRGNLLDVDYSPESFLREIGIPFIYKLIAEIEDAFHVSPVLKGFGALDPRNLPDQIAELADHGEVDVKKLAEFYGSPKEDEFQGHICRVAGDLQSPEAAIGEFRAFKTHMFVESQHMRRLGKPCDTTALYSLCKRDGLAQLYPNVVKLISFALIIPCSTASVERGFSLMNSLCTSLRNRLSQNSLDSLMRVCKEGEKNLSNEELNELVEMFKNKKNRKIDL